jgi:hypothetical protein
VANIPWQVHSASGLLLSVKSADISLLLIDLGADLHIKKLNFHHQIFVCSLRFAGFFFAGFGIQVCYNPYKRVLLRSHSN